MDAERPFETYDTGRDMPIVVVSGAIANKPFNGGEAWVRLSWIQGFQKLGFRVHLVEEIARESCTDENGRVVPFEDSRNLAYFREVTEQFGLSGTAVLIYDGGEQVYGSSWPELLDLAGSAPLLVNISGHLKLEPLMCRFRCKAFIDIDPGFTQFWHVDDDSGSRVGGHDLYYTIGQNIGAGDCVIPTCGVEWRRIRQPVVLEDWPVTATEDSSRFTTVANWRGPFGPITREGTSFGLKVHEFRKFIELPERTPETFEVALNIHPADHQDLAALERHGWHVVNPRPHTDRPDAFRHYVQESGAEFSVAQGIYVDTNSGWFSDRTVRYLASGKPALVQDTGFSRSLPVGEGLIPFRTMEEAVAGVESIGRDYDAHCRAARSLAEEYFDSDKVLAGLLEDVGVAP